MESKEIDDRSKTFWLLSLSMVINFAVMYTIAQFSLDAQAVPASGMTEAIRSILDMSATALYIVTHCIFSSRFCRYYCDKFNSFGEVVYELVVLGIPCVIFYAVMIIHNADTVVAAGDKVDCYLGGGLALSFSGRNALTVVTSVLIILFPSMLIAKAFIVLHLDSIDERSKRAAEYRNLSSSLLLVSELSSNEVFSNLQKKLKGNKDYQMSKVFNKREKHDLRVQITVMLLLALNITLLHVFSYPQATQWLNEAQTGIYGMLTGK